MRIRNTILPAAALLAGLGFGLAPAGAATAAPAVNGNYLALNPDSDGAPNGSGNGGWCITEPQAVVGTDMALDQCEGSLYQDQDYTLISVDEGGTTVYEFQFIYSGLCITLNALEGQPNGGIPVVGKCIAAKDQLFQLNNTTHGAGTVAIVSWYTTSSNGEHDAIDDQSNRLVNGNPIDVSNPSYNGSGQDTYASQTWGDYAVSF